MSTMNKKTQRAIQPRNIGNTSLCSLVFAVVMQPTTWSLSAITASLRTVFNPFSVYIFIEELGNIIFNLSLREKSKWVVEVKSLQGPVSCLVNVYIENLPDGGLAATAREVDGAAGVGNLALQQLSPVLVPGGATASTAGEGRL